MADTVATPGSGERQIFLFLLWEASRQHEAEIIDDIGRHFTILKQYEVLWPQAGWVRHLEAFYGHASQVWIAKARRNGTGPFRVVIVEDPQSRYDLRDNLRGMKELVNVNIYDAKQRYRKLIRSKDKVHSSVNLRETRHNLAVLLDMTLEQFLRRVTPDGAVEHLFAAPQAVTGWRSLEHLFTILNETVPYVVMRNFETLLSPQAAPSDHEDIDLMVSSRELFVAITGARRMSGKPTHVGHLLRVGERVVKLDLREPDDGYYAPALARDMIARGEVRDGVIRVPCAEDHFYTLLYHALIHKQAVAPDYRAFFPDAAPGLGLAGFAERYAREGDACLKALLAEWLCRNGYPYCRPRSGKVGFNSANLADGPGVLKLKPSRAHLCSAELGFNRLKLHLLTGVDLPNLFRFQLRLGGLFKIDLCLGEVKEIGI
ncbi:MAG: hypothetical protein RBT78_11575 [Kiritimatiellia bacterium]|jgi:hypothetical protein|nr:hypothetical protein [Kiritimatiellia bacterium]